MTFRDGTTGAETDTPERVVAVDETAVDKREPDHVTVRALLSEYMEGALSPDERERVARHLGGCRACRAYLHSLKQTIDLARQLPGHRMPDRQKRQIVDRLATAGVGRAPAAAPGGETE